VASGSCEDKVGPIAEKHYPNYRIVRLEDLDKDVREYFARAYPNGHPGCVEEDFDGDGLLDYALLLRTEVDGKTTEKVVVLRGRGDQSFVPINLDVLNDRSGSFFVRYVPPGEIRKWQETTRSKMKTIILKHPGFELVLYESASRVYYWRGKRFHSVQSSD
jgi:hypothetical protein